MKNSYENHKLNKEIAESKFEVKTYVTGQQIENIIVDALHSGIGYWAMIDTMNEKFKKLYDEGFSTSEIVVNTIFNGGAVEILDKENNCEKCKFSLSLESILRGIEYNQANRPFDSNLDNMDSTTVDCIMQYAVLGKVIYG